MEKIQQINKEKLTTSQQASGMSANFNRIKAGRAKEWHPTASKCCLH